MGKILQELKRIEDKLNMGDKEKSNSPKAAKKNQKPKHSKHKEHKGH